VLEIEALGSTNIFKGQAVSSWIKERLIPEVGQVGCPETSVLEIEGIRINKYLQGSSSILMD